MLYEQKHYQTLVVGSGCAGFNAADWLYDLGVTNIALITEGLHMGTSRNTGSDKQTYYKLTLSGDESDSVYDMAKTLFDGGGVHGDTALAEAAGSVRAFMKLTQLGVPFPTNRYGAYVGYKTDHDPRQRATSCGPLTSRLMTEALERAVIRKGIPILDQRQVIKLLVEDGHVQGLAVINKTNFKYEVYTCDHIILTTGGPAGVYADTVYPESQTGGTGLALDAGADLCNMQEWQYGLASTGFRWNVSGTYQQVLPRYISIDEYGDEHEFLPDYFTLPVEALNRVFLKGYQWPFDTRKQEGSSQIDLLVARESYELGRRVYMDFRTNPMGLENGFEALSAEAYRYLHQSGALFGRPIDRLAHMNPKAVELYRSHGIDLYNEPLPVAVCAQHCNGGVAVDCHWESSIKGLYVAGEAAGTFGVYRPGGSALNATQVGSMRAAEHIAQQKTKMVPPAGTISYCPPDIHYTKVSNIAERHRDIQRRMSRYAAYRRTPTQMRALYDELREYALSFYENSTICAAAELPMLYKNYDIILTQIAVLSAMLFSAEHVGSRGGALVEAALKKDNDAYMDHVVVTRGDVSHFEPVRPLPVCDDWFETVWREYESERKIKG